MNKAPEEFLINGFLRPCQDWEVVTIFLYHLMSNFHEEIYIHN